MKKLILLTVVAALPLTLMAQDDDMYFVPSKENVAKEAKTYGMPSGKTRKRRRAKTLRLTSSVRASLGMLSVWLSLQPTSVQSTS